ncbi:hypothetical protein E1B28_000655 [Marasmius oreades]|uniref:Phosphatase phospho-type n=1 Tax=Marasmius oreades TaxID=181124 RepID=A0A9P8AEU7_9AGAR|nr:uncharacterized protein E1B28_000655 [Marasmius oreades]KAG7098745.1 hypothetical protein E1B28_000655 [Marasmius oreades]
MATVERQLVVFDFDWSMADQDTDRWIFEVLAPDIRRKMEDLDNKVQWTDLVAQSLREAHTRGIKREEIEHVLRSIPYHPAMGRAVTKLKAGGRTTFLCLSNANSVFINTILEEKGLETLFEEIITNPAHFEESGLLNLRRRISADGPQHQCKVGCSPNMCKGEELDAFLARHAPAYDRIVYVGDGSNDFCPVLRLRSQDIVLCRTFGGLPKRVARDGDQLKCHIKYWTGAWEIEEVFTTF